MKAFIAFPLLLVFCMMTLAVSTNEGTNVKTKTKYNHEKVGEEAKQALGKKFLDEEGQVKITLLKQSNGLLVCASPTQQ